MIYYYYLKFILAYSCKSRSQQEIKVIHPSALQMICTVLIRAIFCSSIAGG